MTIFVLKIKAELEGVEKLSIIPNNDWLLDISDGNQETKQGITMSTLELLDLKGSKGQAHFVMTWPHTTAQAYMKIVDVKGCNGEYRKEKSGEFQTILAVECRKIEPTAWHPQIDFNVTGDAEESYFPAVDMTDGDWCEYDERNDLSLTVLNLEWRWEKQ